MSDAGRSTYEFGPFRLDVAEQRLLRDGRVLPLTPKVFDVLRVLVQNSGHLVEKETLFAEVWPDSFVEEGALSRSVSILRKTLGENGSAEYIETVPKRGYRFVAPVTRCHVDEGETRGAPGQRSAATAPLAVQDSSVTEPDRGGRAFPWLAGLVAAALIAAVAAAWPLRRSPGETSVPTRSAPEHRQLTFTGIERSPAISPDGRRIAYVSLSKPDKRLVVQELAGGRPLTIFTAPEISYLRWSPDGNDLIFWARGPGKNGVYVMPQLGGTPRQIGGSQFIGSWSHDGSTIALAGYDGHMRFVDPFGRPQRTVLLQDANWSIWDIDWSAKDMLTFVSSDNQGRYTIWTMKPDGSEQRRLVESDSEITTARWDRRGDAVYYLRRLTQTFSLFKIPFAGKAEDRTPIAIMAGLESDRFFALSADRRRLVYARAPYYSNLWLVTASTDRSGTSETRELTHGTSLVERPSVSPDGTSVVFNVGHESSTNLHTMPIAGGPSTQLGSLDSLSVGGVWSGDGKQIAFASTKGGQPRVWLVDAGGGAPRAVSSTNMSDTFNLTWSPGSRVLYQQAGNQNYYVLDPRTGQERRLLDEEAVGWIFSPAYSPDGRRIAAMWNRPPVRGIWVLDVADGRGAAVYPTKSGVVAPIGWAADGQSIYVVEGKNLHFRGLAAARGGETATEARILEVPVNGGPAKSVLALPFEEIGGISMTPDRRSFVCAVYTSRSDIWVVDDFDPSP
jgi:Tol biopolymer transport system component/DNA-binding winged helix-turn-helix (wHTH) protein